MPRDLFGDVTDPSIKVGSRKWYTVPLSLALHTVAVLTARHRAADGDRRLAGPVTKSSSSPIAPRRFRTASSAARRTCRKPPRES